MAEDVILSVKNISKSFGDLQVLREISFDIHKGEKIAILGPSGSGKSTILRCINQLETYDSGEIDYMGKPVNSGQALHELRQHIGMVFQRFNVFTHMSVLQNVIEAPVHVKKVPKQEAIAKAKDLLKMVGLEGREEAMAKNLSGGQRQRICIARALALNPEFIVCDEPVSALDVSIQAQIINLLKNLQKKYNLTYLFISHDLSVVEYISDTVGVMYLGNLVEYGATEDIFRNPLHPYTKALFSAIPVPDPTVKMERIVLEGSIPSPANPPAGCKFHTRCANCMEKCKTEVPQQREIEPGHYVVCHLYDEA